MHSFAVIPLCLRVIEISIDDSGLPKLESIQLGERAFAGDPRDNRKGFLYRSYYSENILTMRSGIKTGRTNRSPFVGVFQWK